MQGEHMSLLAELNASGSRIVDCVRLAAVWVGHIDHDFSEDERETILARLPDRPDGMPIDRIVHYVRQGMKPGGFHDICSVFAFVRDTLAPQSREPLIRLVCETVAADGRVSIGERHGIAFLADLLSMASELPRLFHEETGIDWTAPADLSDPAYWDRLEAARRAQEQQESQRSSSRERAEEARNTHSGQRADSTADSARVEALATLGLVGNPSAEDIKAAYRRLAKIHHPDRFQGLDEDAVAHATRTFQRINAAYGFLTR